MVELDTESIIRLSPHGESGLKFDVSLDKIFVICLSPHGESGLKY